jgi:hypothetical protein
MIPKIQSPTTHTKKRERRRPLNLPSNKNIQTYKSGAT